jgi:hypothetical protein
MEIAYSYFLIKIKWLKLNWQSNIINSYEKLKNIAKEYYANLIKIQIFLF